MTLIIIPPLASIRPALTYLHFRDIVRSAVNTGPHLFPASSYFVFRVGWSGEDSSSPHLTDEETSLRGRKALFLSGHTMPVSRDRIRTPDLLTAGRTLSPHRPQGPL